MEASVNPASTVMVLVTRSTSRNLCMPTRHNTKLLGADLLVRFGLASRTLSSRSPAGTRGGALACNPRCAYSDHRDR